MLKNLNPADKSSLFFYSLICLLVLVFLRRIAYWPVYLLVNAAMIAAIVLLSARATEQSSPLLRFLRCFYPMAFFFVAYKQSGRLNQIIFNGFLDAHLECWEQALFGCQPALELSRRFPQVWLSEYMHFAYFSYYFMVFAFGIILFLKKNHEEYWSYLFALCNTFYLCYLIFIFLPAAGPYFFYPEIFFKGKFFAKIMKTIYANFEIPGGAFPSSHVAATAVVIYYSWKCARKSFAIFALLGASLAVATVYCGYHYVVDVLAGIATAVLVIAISSGIIRKQPKSS